LVILFNYQGSVLSLGQLSHNTTALFLCQAFFKIFEKVFADASILPFQVKIVLNCLCFFFCVSMVLFFFPTAISRWISERITGRQEQCIRIQCGCIAVGRLTPVQPTVDKCPMSDYTKFVMSDVGLYVFMRFSISVMLVSSRRPNGQTAVPPSLLLKKKFCAGAETTQGTRSTGKD